jgi:hypothetical protein
MSHSWFAYGIDSLWSSLPNKALGCVDLPERRRFYASRVNSVCQILAQVLTDDPCFLCLRCLHLFLLVRVSD